MKFSARSLEITLDENGYIISVLACGQEVLKKPSPIVTVLKDGCAYTPIACRAENGLIIVETGGGSAALRVSEEDTCVTVCAEQVDSGIYGIVFGSLYTTLDETVGDVLGICHGNGIAFGMMSLNAKTLEGVRQKYDAAFEALNNYKDEDTAITTGGMNKTERAATRLDDGGSVIHFFCKDRSQEELLTIGGIPECRVNPLPAGDPDADIRGGKVMLLADKSEHILELIGEIEQQQGLPHPMLDGEWVKTSRRAMKSYLISEFTKDEVDMVLDKAQLAGMDTIYHSEPFKTWGHFEWVDGLAESDEDFRISVTEKAKARGMHVGLHTLTNFTTTNDAYVSPVPSRQLVHLAELKLLADTGADDDTVTVTDSAKLQYAQTLNCVHIGDELMTFTATENGVLTGVTRGAFGTKAAAHKAGDDAYLLKDHPYRIFFPDIALQDKLSGRLVELFNNTGAEQISFDGYEGCSATGHDIYAPTRFMMDCARGWDHFVLNDGSGLHHFGWHFSTRMNWGEPWGEAMRTGQVEGRMKNQDFYRRNLFPRMLGWFLIRIADRKFEATTREDIDWAMSEACGFDSGFSITVKTKVMRRHGRVDELLNQIKCWDRLRYAQAFTAAQAERLRKPENEYRLEQVSETEYRLIPISISKPYNCNLGEMQPGQRGGADWSITNKLEPSFAFRLKVEGDGAITDPIFTTANGSVKFPCRIEAGQYLLFDPDGRCEVTDKNYNTISTVTPIGKAAFPRGTSSFSFACGHDRDEEPEVAIRFITMGIPEAVRLAE